MKTGKPIKGFSRYSATFDGHIIRLSTGRMMKEFIDKEGYHRVVMVDDNGRKRCALVHRVVAIAWIDNPKNKPQVDHIDTRRDNNHVKNLRWVTGVENANNPNRRKWGGRKPYKNTGTKTMKKEEVVNVPLEPGVKAALAKQARENGRAMIREAAKLIADGVKKGARK